jgi:hypothetical protein
LVTDDDLERDAGAETVQGDDDAGKNRPCTTAEQDDLVVSVLLDYVGAVGQDDLRRSSNASEYLAQRNSKCFNSIAPITRVLSLWQNCF